MLSVYLGFGRTMLFPSVSLLRTVWRVGLKCLEEASKKGLSPKPQKHKHHQYMCIYVPHKLLNLLIN